MKTPKLLFAVAIVFAALSFSFRANALEVHVISTDSSGPWQTYWYVTLHDNNTNEDYYKDNWNRLPDVADYNLGSVPDGDYAITVSYNGPNSYEHFDWHLYSEGAYGYLYGSSYYDYIPETYIGDYYNVLMYSNTDYQLTSSVVTAGNINLYFSKI